MIERRPRGIHHLVGRAAGTIVLLLVVGCAKNDVAGQPSAECTCRGAPLVSKEVLAFLSKASSAHHRADIAEQKGDRGGALSSLEVVVSGLRPAESPEADEVTADTYARMADLRSEVGDFDAALRDVDHGLALAAGPSHFRGHLFEVRGVVYERLAKTLDTAGKQDAAASAREHAMEAFGTAVSIQNVVIEAALGRRDQDKNAGVDAGR